MKTSFTGFAILVIVLCGCPGEPGGGDHEDNYAIIPDSTQVASADTLAKLEPIPAPDDLGRTTITFASTNDQIGGLGYGDIVILGESASSPNGFIGTVTGVSHPGGKTAVSTSPAGLSDAIQEGHVERSLTLDGGGVQSLAGMRGLSMVGPPLASTIDLHFDDLEVASGIFVRGTVSFTVSLDLSLDIDGFHCESFEFVTTTSLSSDLQFSCDVSGAVDEKVKVGTISFLPITVPAGPVPVVLLPVLDIYVGMNGTASLDLTSGLQQTATLTAGVTYDGDWTPVNEFSSDFAWTQPTVHGECDLKGFLGPELSILIYGVVGPYAGIHGYLELEATMPDADPFWGLYGGIDFGLGVKVQVLGIDLADWYADGIIDYRKQLAAGHGAQSLNWQVQTLAQLDSGEAADVAVDALGRIHLAYVGTEPGGPGDNLYHALYDGNVWTTELVDEYVGDVSLAVDSQNRPRIAYKGSGGVRYAWKDQAGWHDEPAAAMTYAMCELSLALDANGKPHISFMRERWDPVLASVHDLMYVNKTGSSWSTPQAIENQGATGAFIGDYNSCAFDSADTLWVAYYGNYDGIGKCRIARKSGSSWVLQDVETGSSQPGRYVSLALDSDRYPRVSYCRTSQDRIRVASWDGSGWVLDQGPDEVTTSQGEHSSIAIDDSGATHVTYEDGGGAILVLKYARWRSAGWSLETVDTSGLELQGASTMTLDADGRAHCAYFVYAPDGYTVLLRHAKFTGVLD